ncbi:MAG: hypothetical protein ACYTG4_01585 [Planctomycetota bacterium]|jgi:nitrate reductase cytochrome c-type subunit
MTDLRWTALLAVVLLAVVLLVGCGGGGEDGKPVPGSPDPVPVDTGSTPEGAVKTAAVIRAERRAYDGAPPVIPHDNFGMKCISCHNEKGIAVPDVGFAPPMPHEMTDGISGMSRCVQCHVWKTTDEVFAENDFLGLRQDLRKGKRLNPLAPPVMPHSVSMRENCSACHDGPAAREEIRTPHPERERCVQCHVPRVTVAEFSR